MDSKTNFRDLLKEHIELKGLNNKKLAELTGIPERYIEALTEGQDQILPPAPYIRGYIAKLSTVLDFEKESMWRLYQDDTRVQRSGQADKLPSNRFAVHTLDKRWIIGGLVSLFLILYLSTNVYQMFHDPNLQVNFPATETLVWSESLITLRGVVDSVNTLTINGVEVYVNRDGKFEKEYNLQPGLNTIEFVAKKFLGQQAKVVRQVIYKQEEVEEINDEPKQEQRAKE